MSAAMGDVARVWRGRTTAADADAYEDHLRTDTLRRLAALDGFKDAYLLRRTGERGVDFLVLTLWASREAIHAFAGEDAERAVIPAAAAKLLKHWDERATHYEVALVVDASR
jgi:heme-degrading monooxygenase HmoA